MSGSNAVVSGCWQVQLRAEDCGPHSMQASPAVCSCSYTANPTSKCLTGRQAQSVLNTSRRLCRGQGRRRAVLRSVAALSPDQLHDFLPQLLDHVSMAYERVTLPCSAMNCGDMIHKRCAFDTVLLKVEASLRLRTQYSTCVNISWFAALWILSCEWNRKASTQRAWACWHWLWHTLLPRQVTLCQFKQALHHFLHQWANVCDKKHAGCCCCVQAF